MYRLFVLVEDNNSPRPNRDNSLPQPRKITCSAEPDACLHRRSFHSRSYTTCTIVFDYILILLSYEFIGLGMLLVLGTYEQCGVVAALG